jgi:hypothetical protein
LKPCAEPAATHQAERSSSKQPATRSEAAINLEIKAEPVDDEAITIPLGAASFKSPRNPASNQLPQLHLTSPSPSKPRPTTPAIPAIPPFKPKQAVSLGSKNLPATQLVNSTSAVSSHPQILPPHRLKSYKLPSYRRITHLIAWQVRFRHRKLSLVL